jgi:hypothetical protein
VLTTGTRFVVWHRKPGDWQAPDPTAGRHTRTPEAPDWFTVPAPPGAPPDLPRVVEVEYDIRNRLAGVPVLGKLPRYLLGPTECANRTAVSLPPYRTTWSFIVYPLPGKTPTFYAHTFSLVGGKVTITRVHVRPLAASKRQVDALLR